MSLYDKKCKECPLHLNPGRTCISGTGNSKSSVKVVVVEDAPSREESEGFRINPKRIKRILGKPYTDDRAELIASVLKDIGFKKGEVWCTYALKCNPKGKVKIKDVHTCAEKYLVKELDLLKPELIICFGKSAQVAVLKMNSALAKTHGRLFDYEGDGWSCKVMTVDHPFAIISSPGKEDTWRADLARAYAFLKSPDSPFWEKEKLDRFNFVEITSIDHLKEVVKDLTKEHRGSYLAVDVEASGLDDDIFRKDFKMYTVQFGIVDMEEKANNDTNPVYILPFMSEHFDVCEGTGWQDKCKKVLTRLFEEDRFKLVAHNGKYDLKVLNRFGIETYLQWDTMILWANVHGEASMSLKEIAYQVTDLGGYDVEMAEYFKEHKSFDAPPELLIPYGGLDIVSTRHLLHELSSSIS